MQENVNNVENAVSEVELSEILQIRRDKLANLCDAGNNPFEKVKYDIDAYTTDIVEKFDEYEGKTVKIAGRLMSRRDMGKANFIDVLDGKGRIQCYIRINDVGEDVFEQYKKWDIGDIIGLSGMVFRTRRGEISVHVYEIELLAKSLLPLPEKFHGLKDQETRYRQRYVDLIVNPEVKDTLVLHIGLSGIEVAWVEVGHRIILLLGQMFNHRIREEAEIATTREDDFSARNIGRIYRELLEQIPIVVNNTRLTNAVARHTAILSLGREQRAVVLEAQFRQHIKGEEVILRN